jgi:biopolymer transport protein ExbD
MGTPGRKGRIRPVKKIQLDEMRNEINVTPLVDVCLVLLIIFMVVTPLMARGKEVSLPQTKNHTTENDKLQPIVVVGHAGKLFFDKDEVADIDELTDRIEKAWEATGGEHRVFLKAEQDLAYKEVYPVILALHELGVPGVDLGTNELRGKKE